MNERFKFLNHLIPECLDTLDRRLEILQLLAQQTLGRRALAQRLNESESRMRKDLQMLTDRGLLETTSRGMQITAMGLNTLKYADTFHLDDDLWEERERRLAQLLGIGQVSIIPGDSEEDPTVLAEMGQRMVEVLDRTLPKQSLIVAVTGGTSVAAVGDQMDPSLAEGRDLTFIPGRGGIGEGMHIQANSVCATMARRTRQRSYALYTPDHVGEETQTYLMREPEIRKVIDLLDQADAFIFGIGEATTMASRRQLHPDTQALLEDRKAIGEVFGEYFNEQGDKVYELSRLGLTSAAIADIAYPMAIAGGRSKACAIKAYLQSAPDHIHLVTDEAAYEEIIKGEKNNDN